MKRHCNPNMQRVQMGPPSNVFSSKASQKRFAHTPKVSQRQSHRPRGDFSILINGLVLDQLHFTKSTFCKPSKKVPFCRLFPREYAFPHGVSCACCFAGMELRKGRRMGDRIWLLMSVVSSTSHLAPPTVPLLPVLLPAPTATLLGAGVSHCIGSLFTLIRGLSKPSDVAQLIPDPGTFIWMPAYRIGLGCRILNKRATAGKHPFPTGHRDGVSL